MITTQKNTLLYAAKIYIVYLHSLRLPIGDYQTNLRVLRHILKFYGGGFPLNCMNGDRVLQYADLYDPYADAPLERERGQVFWRFVHFLKKNEMIPAWTEPAQTDIL